MTFEEKIKRIEEISQSLDASKLGLDESIKVYEEGILLAKDCLESLELAKGKVVQIKKSISLENDIEEDL